MRVLLTGATGFIGGHLLRALTAAGHEVVACGRKPPFADSGFVPCDYAADHRPETWEPRLTGIDAVINAVGIIRETGRQTFSALHADTPRALFAACEAVGVRRVIQISALGADASAVSRYHLSKRTADDDLAGRRLDWLILRPSIVYGPGAKSSAFFRALALLPLVPLVDKGEQPLQPIHIDDLVRAVLIALESGEPRHQRIDCVGPRPLSYRRMLGAWRQWLGAGSMRTMSVPYRAALAAGRVGGFIADAPLDREAVGMLQRGSEGDVVPFIEAFGFRPRAFEAALLATPATEADRWHARLFFLRPLLRWSLGVMWIMAGVTSAFLYPADDSYALLARLGIGGLFAPAALYGAALLDTLLGLALLVVYKVPVVGAVQIAVILGYSTLISWGLPEYWLHPFGPVAKNLPILVATLIMMALEARAR